MIARFAAAATGNEGMGSLTCTPSSGSIWPKSGHLAEARRRRNPKGLIRRNAAPAPSGQPSSALNLGFADEVVLLLFTIRL